MRAELIQTAAVAVAMIESLDRNCSYVNTKDPTPSGAFIEAHPDQKCKEQFCKHVVDDLK